MVYGGKEPMQRSVDIIEASSNILMLRVQRDKQSSCPEQNYSKRTLEGRDLRKK